MEKVKDEITKKIIAKLIRDEKGFSMKNLDIKYINKAIAKHLLNQNLK